MSFSALILTYNETDTLLDCAKSILALNGCTELIVFQNFGYLDQGPTLTKIQAECSAHTCEFHTIRSDRDVSSAVAINHALESIKNEFLLYIQAGCYVDKTANWQDVEAAFAQDPRCRVVGFPILSGATLKGISPFFSPSGHRYSEGGLVGKDASILDTMSTCRIPEPMPQAFALRRFGTQLDTSSWYNFELTALTLDRPVLCCSSFRIQHKDQGIRRNRAACSNEWKRRETIGAEALKHHFGTSSKIGFEWALIKRYILPYLGQPGTPDTVVRNLTLQLSILMGVGIFLSLLFLPLFICISLGIIGIFIVRNLLWFGLTYLGKLKP